MKKFINNKPIGMLSSSELRSFYGQAIYWVFWCILFLTSVICLVPGIWTIFTAFKDTQEIYNSLSFFPADMSWNRIVSRITESWEYLNFGKSFINTIVLSIGSLVFKIVICGFGGYALSKAKPIGTSLIFTLIVWTMMMPGNLRSVPNYITYLHFPFAFDNGLGINLLDTFWPMWLSGCADCFSVLLFKNAFDGLSNAYVEAAKIDGCNGYQIFFKIMMPLATPVVIYQAIGILSGAWSDFYLPLLVLDKKSIIPLEIFRMQGNAGVKMNMYFMALVFASIPPFIIFVIFQKRILGGVNVGGVKG